MKIEDHLESIINLNQEYLTASQARKKEIEDYLVSLVDKQESEQIKELQDLHAALKQEIISLASNAQGMDLDTYNVKILELSKKINSYASSLSVNLPETDLGQIFAKILREFD